jgi:ADP-heptose:LPS heptosyltransferase
MTGDVLALRALGLGDALMVVPALRGARRVWPDSRLHLAGPLEVGRWLRGLGLIDEVVPAEGLGPLPWRGMGHVALNLHGRGPRSHQVLAATRPARLVGFAADGFAGPQWRDDEHDVLRWCRLLRAYGGQCGPDDLRLTVPRQPGRLDEVLVHPGAGAPARRWPADRWASVVATLVQAGHNVALTGTVAERPLCSSIVAQVPGAGRALANLAGELSLDELASRVAGAALVVSGDTGVGHLATAVETPSVLLFGPTPPQLRGPAIDHEWHVVLWHGTHPRRADANGATLDPALAQIRPDEVLAAVDHLVDRRLTRAG